MLGMIRINIIHFDEGLKSVTDCLVFFNYCCSFIRQEGCVSGRGGLFVCLFQSLGLSVRRAT